MKQVILVNYGGPENSTQIKDYLFHLFSNPDVIQLPAGKVYQSLFARIISKSRSRKLRENYEAIGGSPLASITRSLVEKLNRRGKHNYSAVMAFSPPFLKDVINELPGKEIFIFPLFPHFSRTTTGACLSLARKSSKRVFYLREYWNDPDFNALIIKRIGKALAKDKDSALLFSAHSIPLSYTRKGDPYLESIQSHFTLLKDSLPEDSLFLGFQSKVGPFKWVGPGLNEVLVKIKERGFKGVIIYPLSFVVDNYETNYEVDINYRNNIIYKLNILFKRISCLNDSQDFVSFIEKKVDEEKWLELP